MGAEVYANGRSVSCKSADGKSICAFPDVCLTPPPPPAGPIPIPYPNTGMASDTTDGSKSVTAKGKEVMLKNKSYFKKSMGDEAATKAQGMGVVTHQIQGKVYFNAWSMDVKIEGENAVRQLDLTTHNHGSVPANTPTWPYMDSVAVGDGPDPCKEEKNNTKDACSGVKADDCPEPGPGYKEHPCVVARRCELSPYDPKKCCGTQTPHHLLPKRGFKKYPGYDAKKAPCVCAEGWSWHRNDNSKFAADDKTHPDMHDIQDYFEAQRRANPPPGRTAANAVSYSEAKQDALAAHSTVFSEAGCSRECIEAQMDAYHKQESVGVKEDDLLDTSGTIRTVETMAKDAEAMKRVAAAEQARSAAAAAAPAMASGGFSG